MRASRRVLRAGGRIAYSVLGTGPGGSVKPRGTFNRFMIPADRYRPMMMEAGFTDYTERDVTDAFHGTATRWIEAATELEAELRAALGSRIFDDKYSSRAETLDAIETGEVRRLLIAATA